MSYCKDPKIIILGIDGLEYNLVKEWRLKNIMQNKYCKVNLSDYNVIVTPPIWGSMLTGMVDKEILGMWTRYAKIIGNDEKLEEKPWAKAIAKLFPEKFVIWFQDRLVKMFVGGNPFDITANFVRDKNQKTIFDFFEKTWTNGIPGYGKNVSGPEQKALTARAIAGEKKPYRNFILEQYKKDKSELLAALGKKEYELIFWYTPMLDNFGHMDMGNPLGKMMKHYLEINSLVGKVKEICPKSIVYIISDHGMERMEPKKSSWGAHSDHAFFSSSNGDLIKKPIHLYELISKHISG